MKKAKKQTSSKKTDKQTNTIFVQIAAYRDPELKATLKDMFEKARYPDNLKVCIAWQHSPDEKLDEYINDPRFIIIDIPHLESKGACWARSLIQQKYNGEKFTLQLDSHHRFVQDWDVECIQMLEGLQKDGFKKPLITSYIPSYDPQNDPAARVGVPWRMDFDRFIPEGAVFFLPASIDDHMTRTKPVRGRFYSAHFAFTVGVFCKEVPHDPDYYFHGEEISIAVRAYTHGYDIFHPHKVIAWHEYTRNGRTKQWDDVKDWGKYNEKCHAKNRKLFGMDGETPATDFGIYGFGTERTLDQYERYAGVCFKTRSVQQHTLDHKEPPNPVYSTEQEYQASFLKIFKHCIDIGYHQVPEKDYDFWVVAFHDKDENTMFRKDADRDEVQRMLNDPDKYCKVWREFQAAHKPAYWVVWPHSVSKGWCERITGNL
jgi:hypothetical protein